MSEKTINDNAKTSTRVSHPLLCSKYQDYIRLQETLLQK